MQNEAIADLAPDAGADRPFLSLCLATYNRARYLDRYLTHHLTALETAGIDYELVVSDNCSTDETPDILARYAARHPRMKVERQPRNLGAYPNQLAVIRRARGEVVVSIADDDLAIPHQLIAYARRLAEDPSLSMIQAPWLRFDETRGGAILGQFYQLDGETRFARGSYGDCLAFLVQNHVFPECFLIRRSALPAVAGPAPRFAHSFLVMLANALGKGDVLFCPEPHVTVTSVSEGDNRHLGNTEAMEGWDLYRGGLELLASYARQAHPGGWASAAQVAEVVQIFIGERMEVAARLHAHARNWSSAYELLRRMHAYGLTPKIDYGYADVCALAMVESALLECVQRGASEIVLADTVEDHVLEKLRPIEGARLIRASQVRPEDRRRAHVSVGPTPAAAMRDGDFAIDLAVAMARFPQFPPGTP